MKKLLALALVLVLCFSFAACTVDEEPDSSSNSAVVSTVSSLNSAVVSTVSSSSSAVVSTVSSSSSTVTSTVPPSSSAVVSTVKNNEKIENFIKTQDATLEATRESLKDMMTIELEARGNSLVYKYTYIIDTGDADILKASLDDGMKSQEKTFKNSLTLIRTSVPEIESMIIEYYDINKKLIVSYEFK